MTEADLLRQWQVLSGSPPVPVIAQDKSRNPIRAKDVLDLYKKMKAIYALSVTLEQFKTICKPIRIEVS